MARLAALLLGVALCGCAPSGLIFTETVRPLDTNLDATRRMDVTRKGDLRTLQYWSIRVQWKGNAIGDIAREHHFTRVDYADLETLSVLGVWTQRWVRIYGVRELP